MERDQERAPTTWTRRRLGRVAAALVVALITAGVVAFDQRPAVATQSLWGEGAPRAVVDDPDTQSVTLGTIFWPSVPGVITGIRFWKTPGNDGQHVGSLWSVDGRLLAAATFVDEQDSGWQSVTFDRPVAVDAGVRYVAAYLAPEGRYATTEYFHGRSQTRDLAVRSGSVGVYSYGATSAFPTRTWNQAQYWVDVQFRPDYAAASPAPEPDSDVATTPGARPSTAQPSGAPSATGTETPSATPTPTPTPTSSPTRSASSPAPSRSTGPTAAPVPPPRSSAKPGPGNTGVPAGATLTPSGPITVTTPGQVIDSLDVHGSILIEAPGVQIRNTRISGTGDYGILVSDSGATITDSEISGFDNGIAGDEWTATRVDVHDVRADGVKLGNHVLLQQSWFHDFTPAPDAHADGAQMQNGLVDVTVRGNNFELGPDENSAIFLAPDLGPSSNGPITITGNWLDGGGFAVFCNDGNWGQYVTSNISITNNRFGTSSKFGPITANVPVSFTGNVWDATGRPIALP